MSSIRFRGLKSWKIEIKNEKAPREAPAPTSVRAETRLTVYRSLPYQNTRKEKAKCPAHAGDFNHIAVEFGDNLKVDALGNYRKGLWRTY